MRSPLSFCLFSLVALPLFALACSATGDDKEFEGSGSGGSGSTSSGDGGGVLTTSTSGAGGLGENCGATTYASQVPPSLLLVVDRSGSMAGGDGTPDKWAPTVQALGTMTAAAPTDMEVGLLPFPAGDFDASGLALCTLNPSDPACAALFADGGCKDVSPTPVVALGPLSQTKAPIDAWLASNGPDGGTPTLWALKTAYDILRNYPAPGERYVLLITDGEPNQYSPAMSIGPFTIPESNIECKLLADIEAEALGAASGAPAVKTFVIGSPGSEPAAKFLSQVAVNGQTQKSPACSAAAGDCHYQIGSANFQTELEAALDAITGQVSDCVFAIPTGTEEVDPNKVNVQLETESGTTLVYKDTSHQDGWDYTDATQTKIRIYGPACEAYKAEQGAKVTIVLGCETIVK